MEYVKYVKKAGIMYAVFLLASFVVFAPAPIHAADYRIGGRWLTEGGGFVEKGILRVSLSDKGWLDIITTYKDGVETITGYKVQAELTASKLDINAWKYVEETPQDPHIPVKDFNPSMSDPFKFPQINFDDMRFDLVLTSVHSGTLKLRGFVDIEGVGRCEVNADNAIWKEGTPKPRVPDTESGCNAAGAPMLLPMACLFFLLSRRCFKR